MAADLEKRIEKVRDALHEAGKDLSAPEWKELLEAIDADIYGHLESVKEENQS